VNSVVIRAGDFFGGPGRGSWFDLALASRLDRGRFIYPGAMNLVHAWAYLPDLAQVFVRVASQRGRLAGHHRLHVAGHPVNGEQMRLALESAAGRPLRSGDLPWGLIRLAAPLVPTWRELVTMRYLWQRPHTLDDSALRQLIGPVPQTPLPEALRASLQELEVAPGPGDMVRA
jgi:nucleoside-diphosphate-sugar epimerase